MAEMWQTISKDILPNVVSFNGTDYRVEKIMKRIFELSTKGCIEAHLKGNKDYEWLRTLQEFYITARSQNEDFGRTFVLDENSFREIAFY